MRCYSPCHTPSHAVHPHPEQSHRKLPFAYLLLCVLQCFTAGHLQSSGYNKQERCAANLLFLPPCGGKRSHHPDCSVSSGKGSIPAHPAHQYLHKDPEGTPFPAVPQPLTATELGNFTRRFASGVISSSKTCHYLGIKTQPY